MSIAHAPDGGVAASAGDGERTAAVARFYDAHTHDFLRVCGEVIQAFRTTDITRLLDMQAQAMGLAPGMRVLDAGCGVCGPAVYFARRFSVTVDAVTLSPVQAELATARIRDAGVGDRVRVRVGDYHHLPRLFPAGAYDVVYFLESFGHSHDKGAAVASAWEALRPGGRLYVKDLFVKEAVPESNRAAIEENVGRINRAYCYEVADLYEVLRLLRRQGFVISALKTIDIPPAEFENLSLANDFQELTGIHAIADLDAYVFPVDFLELICTKPPYAPERGTNREYLQNLYWLQARGLREDEL